MKAKILACLIALLALSSCRFEYPFFVHSGIPIDRSILGTWQLTNKEGLTNPNTKERYIVLPYSKTEYLILSGAGGREASAYYRGYPIPLEDHNAVQLEFIGTSDGPIETKNNDRYALISYEFKDGLLEIYMLDPTLIQQEPDSIKDLQKILNENLKNPDLFGTMLRLKRDLDTPQSLTQL